MSNQEILVKEAIEIVLSLAKQWNDAFDYEGDIRLYAEEKEAIHVIEDFFTNVVFKDE